MKLKYDILYRDGTKKTVAVNISASQDETDGFIMACRSAPHLYKESPMRSVTMPDYEDDN